MPPKIPKHLKERQRELREAKATHRKVEKLIADLEEESSTAENAKG